MEEFNKDLLKQLATPLSGSHKGQNGKLLLIGGSHLFHAASAWALKVASRIVDMVFYSSVPENNQIILEAKKEFHDGIVVPREKIDDYINEADCVLIGPGMLRAEARSAKLEVRSLADINRLEDEGEQTYYLTKYLLEKYPQKRWVIDAGALQMLEPEWLSGLDEVIITPHQGEFEGLKVRSSKFEVRSTMRDDDVKQFAQEFGCVVLLKGEKDIVCPPSLGEAGSPDRCVNVSGGNAGMTKGGTGDVLAGLVAALACKNDLFLAACAGSYINKKAGEFLFDKIGYVFNTSDLVEVIPVVMKKELAT
ncbi:MAG TPA: NAD(P)H-hydrate dehydratase [Patescibacteria group bacterium]|nr:NAD(P)H-hydrate dehydratase [Patescibacteria group bacterium]